MIINSKNAHPGPSIPANHPDYFAPGTVVRPKRSSISASKKNLVDPVTPAGDAITVTRVYDKRQSRRDVHFRYVEGVNSKGFVVHISRSLF